MKELLTKLIKNHVVILLKSGEKVEDLLIETIIGNALVGSVDGKIVIIEIPHIASVITEDGVVEIIQTILKSEENKKSENKDDSKDTKDDDNKDSKKDSKKDNKKDDKEDSKKSSKRKHH